MAHKVTEINFRPSKEDQETDHMVADVMRQVPQFVLRIGRALVYGAASAFLWTLQPIEFSPAAPLAVFALALTTRLLVVAEAVVVVLAVLMVLRPLWAVSGTL